MPLPIVCLQFGEFSVHQQVVFIRGVVGNKRVEVDLFLGIDMGIGGVNEFRKANGICQREAEIGGNG